MQYRKGYILHKALLLLLFCLLFFFNFVFSQFTEFDKCMPQIKEWIRILYVKLLSDGHHMEQMESGKTKQLNTGLFR